MDKPVISINQVLLFRDPTKSKELGDVLWAATKEVENFYTLGEQRAAFQRSYLSEGIPDSIRSSGTTTNFPLLKRILGYFTGATDRPMNMEASEVAINVSRSESEWKTAEGKFARTYDTRKILRMVHELTGEGKSNAIPVVVTDLMLTPPPNWSYMIWDGDESGAVISIPPTDPKFWRISDPNRIAVIKHRVRTAILSAAGEVLGLKGCDNERCFLFNDVDSVTRLDSMILFGSEHNIEPLKQRGFEVVPKDPAKVQPVLENPNLGDAGGANG